MAFNARDTFTIDLSCFGSLVQDIEATDLPSGVSPDNLNCSAGRPNYGHQRVRSPHQRDW